MKRKFSEEFKTEAVRLVLEHGQSVAQVSRDLGVSVTSLDKWVRAKRDATPAGALSDDERAELKRLRKENSVLRMERDILKKATAFFSKSSLPDSSGS